MILDQEGVTPTHLSERDKRTWEGVRNQVKKWQQRAAAVAKRGQDLCPLVRLGVERIHSLNTDVQWTAGVGSGREDCKFLWPSLNRCTHPWWSQSPLSHIWVWRMGKGGRGKGQGR